jgi:hexosaminidase
MQFSLFSATLASLFLSIFSLSAQVEKTKKINFDIIPRPTKIIHQGEVLQWESDQLNIIYDQELYDQADHIITFFNERGITITSRSKQTLYLSLKKNEGNKESYVLYIKKDSIVIKANYPTGISHGIATLQQLVLLNKNQDKIKLPIASIIDEPRFPHRGLLLDCARHFFDKKTILKYIDLLAFYKMNTLHWHLTEDQGWRIEINKYPKLNSVAASRIEQTGEIYKGIYTQEDIQEIVRYGQTKNITIIPEIELPGHSQAAIAAYPDLSCTGEEVSVANDWGVFKEIYCAGNEQVFKFLEDVLLEVIDLFPSKYVHIGGDEVPKIRWKNCKKCQKRILENNLDGEHELQSYFISRIQKFLNANNREIIGWDEILEGGVSEQTIIQSWRGVKHAMKALESGNSVIMSPTSHAYLDYDLKSIDLKKIYLFDPIPSGSKPEYHKQILGGECNIWTEHVPDEKTLDSKVFPRIMGMAEALWSKGDKNYEKFNSRIQSHYNILDEFEINYGEEHIPILYKTLFDNNSLYLQLIPGGKNLTIAYKRDISNANMIIYDSPILIDDNCKIIAQAYKNKRHFGEPIEIPLAKHKGLGKDVDYMTQFNEFYPANKNMALVDGELGTLDFRDGNWQGFFGKDVEIIMDLGTTTSDISQIITNYYQYSNSWIFLPKSIDIETSLDKTLWIKDNFIEVNPIQNPKSRKKEIAEIRIKAKNKFEARYLKIIIKNYGKVPEWHEAAGSDTWIFMDEIQVNHILEK